MNEKCQTNRAADYQTILITASKLYSEIRKPAEGNVKTFQDVSTTSKYPQPEMREQ